MGVDIQRLVHNQAPWISRFVLHFVGYVKWGPVHQLRKKMQDAMVLRGLAARTQESYLAAVEGIAKYYRRSPDTLSSDEVERYLLHLIEIEVRPRTGSKAI